MERHGLKERLTSVSPARVVHEILARTRVGIDLSSPM